MRTDIQVTNEKVKMPHLVPTIGRGKWIAEKGYIIVTDNGIGRMIGRILDKSELKPNCNGFICAIMLSQDGSFIMERWIDPNEVKFCYDPNENLFGKRSIQNMYHNLFSEQFKEKDCNTLREWSYSGYSHWSNCDRAE
jgi:hypothetical protein